MQRIAHRSIFVVLAPPAVFLLLEVTVRVFQIAPPLVSRYGSYVADPVVPYKCRPFSKLTDRGAGNEFAIECQHNSLGFRDQEHTVQKPKGVFRIVAVGDSFTYGAAVPFEDTYLAQLERLLNTRPAPRIPIEIIKLGMPRYYPEPERLVLESYGLQFEPDLVLVGVVPNDIIDTYLGLDAISVSDSGFLLSREAKRLGCAGVWSYLHSHVARILLSRWVAYVSQRDWPVRPDDIYREDGFHESAWRTMESELERMLRVVQERGAALLIVGIPQKGPWDESSTYPDSRLARWSERHGALFVPTLQALREASVHEAVYWPIDGHCNSAGYGVIARAIFAELMRRNLVP